jgi:alpha-amylase/alpha-mannosidase (GH57 family)
MTSTPPRYLCIHGHFYQPPRENPWLEDVEVQDSAHPYHDWNERITFECYAPNTASRVLDAERRITDIVNNYRKMSFNFGPTLLSWLERRSPAVYAKILEADRLSRGDRSGHGNALAQVYNHIIMPLASRRDKLTQVRWGLRDFERRFGRPAEGIWLAETAADSETLEILADHGLKFTVLSPAQAAQVRPLEKEWTDVSGGRVDPSRAYLWKSKGGKTLALFFYDAPISRAVAFEGLLTDGKVFARRLMDGFAEERTHPQMVHIATDGESYGHHHRFGDMALAYALRETESRGDVTLTNYGEFLERHPPEWEAEIVENSSWSCAHGVERWSADCGCCIGSHAGWTQAWRAPLRLSLDALRDGLDALYEKSAGALLKDPWEARDAYIEALLDRSPAVMEGFLSERQVRPLSEKERVDLRRLLEMQRQRLLMYTSCGWFFDEISGIETVAVLSFAARALQLSRDHAEALALEQSFMEGLAKAKSNLPAYGNGEGVYRRLVAPLITDLPRLAAHEAIESLFGARPDETTLYRYTVKHLARELQSSGGVSLSIGRLRVASELTGETFETSYAALHLGGQDIQCVLKAFPGAAKHGEVRDAAFARLAKGSLAEVMGLIYRAFDEHVYSLQDLLLEERRRLLGSLIEGVLGRYDAIYRSLVEDNRKLIRTLLDAGVPVPPTFRLALQYVLGRDLELSLAQLAAGAAPGSEPAQKLRRLQKEAALFHVELDWNAAARRLGQRLESEMSLLQKGFDPACALRLLDLLKLGEDLGLAMNLWPLENAFFELVRGPFQRLEGENFRIASALSQSLRFTPLQAATA